MNFLLFAIYEHLLFSVLKQNAFQNSRNVSNKCVQLHGDVADVQASSNCW